MLRIDRSVTPTMAKTPTLAAWELEQLRTHRARRTARAHPARASRGRIALEDGSVAHRAPTRSSCTARRPGLKYPPLVPIWAPEAITLQPIRAGFPCFGAALAGYVEATRDDDAEKNRLCPPTPYAEHAWPSGRP